MPARRPLRSFLVCYLGVWNGFMAQRPRSPSGPPSKRRGSSTLPDLLDQPGQAGQAASSFLDAWSGGFDAMLASQQQATDLETLANLLDEVQKETSASRIEEETPIVRDPLTEGDTCLESSVTSASSSSSDLKQEVQREPVLQMASVPAPLFLAPTPKSTPNVPVPPWRQPAKAPCGAPPCHAAPVTAPAPRAVAPVRCFDNGTSHQFQNIFCFYWLVASQANFKTNFKAKSKRKLMTFHVFVGVILC